MSEPIKVKVIKLELLADQVLLFKEIQKALGHTEREQTFEKMLQLIQVALNLTSKENPVVRLYTRDPSKLPLSSMTCPRCQHEIRPETRLEGDGFREVAVSLS